MIKMYINNKKQQQKKIAKKEYVCQYKAAFLSLQ